MTDQDAIHGIRKHSANWRKKGYAYGTGPHDGLAPVKGVFDGTDMGKNIRYAGLHLGSASPPFAILQPPF